MLLQSYRFWLLLAFCIPLLAQDYDKLAPQQVPEPDAPKKLTVNETTEQEQQKNTTQILPTLRGLVFYKDASLIRNEGWPGLEGISIEGVPFVDTEDFRSRFSDRIQKPLMLGDLPEITREVIQYYRDNGRPVTNAIIPDEQDITNGVLQVLILEGRLGDIIVKGNEFFDTEDFIADIRLKKGDLIDADRLNEDQTWANRNPFRRVELSLAQGKEMGEVDVLLNVQDVAPWRVYTGSDLTGSEFSGDLRYFAGLNYGDMFGLGHVVNYQFTTAKDLEMMRGHSISYMAPLPWRHTLSIFGSHSRSRPENIGPLETTGETWQAGARYSIPLKDQGPLTHTLLLGFDFKQTNNNLEIGGESIFASFVDVVQGSVSYSATYPDSQGVTSASVGMVYSPGDMSHHNHLDNFNAVRQNTEPEYMYWTANLSRVQKLPWNLSWNFRAQAQWSEEPLLSTEQIAMGGTNTLRGYEESEATGDRGYVIVNEVSTQPKAIDFGIPGLQGRWQVLGFFDYGEVRKLEILEGEDAGATFMSAGPGFRFSGSNLIIRGDYGWQLKDTGNSRRLDKRAHLSVTLSY